MRTAHVLQDSYIHDAAPGAQMSSQPVQLMLRPRRTSMHVTLHEPANADDECPILQDAIALAKLEACPHSFLAAFPTHTAMTLPCRHTFHAMALVYHWARNGNVQCPICRAGPGKGQCLAINRLPHEWKYSMAARVRRERRKDREEEERAHRHMAMQHARQAAPFLTFELEIRIEAELGVSPTTWTMKTKIIQCYDTVIFLVPDDELQRIPYPPCTRIRLVPHTRMHILQASDWFVPGTDPGCNFGVACSADRIYHIHFAIREEVFAALLNDLIMGQLFGGEGRGFHLLLLPED